MTDSHLPNHDLRSLIDAHREWLIIYFSGRSFPVLNSEIEIGIRPDRIIFGYPDETGYKFWRVVDVSPEENGIHLDLTSDFGQTREKLRLVPRTAAKELGEAVELARLEKANQLARLIAESRPGTKIGRVSLNKENGRTAHIIAGQPLEGKKAYLADVSGKMTPENLLALAMIWLGRLERRKKDPIDEVRIIAEKKLARALQRLNALLKPAWKDHIRVLEISRREDEADLHPVPALEITQLWREKSKKLAIPDALRPCRTARQVVAINPDKIDVIFSRQGETLRFLGLPFARVRTVAGKDRAWFGTGRDKQILSDATWPLLQTLINELDSYRRPGTPSKRHELYHMAPEAWLESLLKRNIARLDANLILSPIYNQFRASADKIDLLALRKDGRLVIIELKTSIDREMIFQAADYWRKIELQRRAGHLREANLFGELSIIDKPALVYLVAPALSFHREFAFFASSLSHEIEMYRFDLHENWRTKIKVLGQRRTGEKSP
jgi:hypothetical protein